MRTTAMDAVEKTGERTPLVMVYGGRDVVLRITIVVNEEDNFEASFDPAGESESINAAGLRQIFDDADLTLHPGTYVFEYLYDAGEESSGSALVSTPNVFGEGFFTLEAARKIIGQDTELAKFFGRWYQDLTTAYKGFPSDKALEELAVSVVTASLTSNLGDDPLKERIELPDVEAIAGMSFDYGCYTCAFTDLRSGVIESNGVRIRVGERDGELTVVIGYLEHQSPFQRLFHDELVARVQPLIEGVVSPTIQDLAGAG